MTKTQIEKKAAREMVKFEMAARIREILDAARKEYGAGDWDDDEIENQIADLVFAE